MHIFLTYSLMINIAVVASTVAVGAIEFLILGMHER